ncbi:BREX-1 system adenine-specific DNA-methyltransferase PglX [Paratractidigestivibacter faecalis]|uniref:site-specific DNA-methyltransferase (adenine-specific) n=1 Tax=Paratractidigestivibacter faecalis TaxID=2292441 RepID=A0ABV1IHU9_9ACTN
MTVNGNAIKACCLKVRSILEAGVEVQLARYDVCEGGAPAGAEVVKGIPLSPEETAQRDELLFLCAQRGRKALLDQAAYTWFNRIAAIHFMEVRGWLPSGVRMFTRADGSVGSQAVDEALDLQMDGLDPMCVAELKASGDDEALFRYLFLLQCEQLHDCLPDVFEPVGSAMELLLPQGLLYRDGPIMHMVSDIPEEDWTEGVEIVGWMYQYYVSERKDEVFAGFKKGKKAEREDIAPATQLFTPNWIVRYLTENSLGRLWMLNRPGSKLTDHMPYFVKPDEDHETEFKHVTTPEDITVVDPACGSGHILVYAFDLLAKIYEEEGYRARDAARLILEKNLSGMEIDPRAAAMASFALTMKARELDSRFLRRGVKPRITVLSRVEFEPEELQYIPNLSARPQLLDAVAHLDECGSLLTVTKDDMDALAGDLASLAGESTIFGGSAVEKLELMRAELEPLGRSYDAVVANPPYMGSSNMDKWLAAWVKSKYKEVCRDLCTCFIKRGMSLAKERGYEALITSDTCMYLSSFEQMRKTLIERTTIIAFIDTRGSNAHPDVFDANAGWVLWNAHSQSERGAYFKLNHPIAEKSERLLEALADPACGWFYRRDADTFKQIPGSPIAYWASDAMLGAFTNHLLADVAKPRQGLVTGDNDEFLREWWEVDNLNFFRSSPSRDSALNSGVKWFPCNKGGGYRRWYGFNDVVVNWQNDGEAIQNYIRNGRQASRPQNMEFYFKEGITWGTISSAKLSMRYSPRGSISEHAGSMIYLDKSNPLFAIVIAAMNSSAVEKLLAFLSPSLRFTEGPVGQVPIPDGISDARGISNLSEKAIATSKADYDSFETSWDFANHPLL